METSRLEIFGDGVFAIAATLLVVRVSVNAPGGALGGALVHAWPQYAAYVPDHGKLSLRGHRKM